MSRPEAPTKYRASCDGCYLAKLKCTKEKPTCPRCKNLGLACTYSPSRRTGKPRASKPQVSSSGSTITTTTIATPITPAATTASSPSQVLTWQPASSSNSAILPSEALASPFDNSLFAPNHDSPLSLMDTTMSDWSSSATTLHDLDSNLLAPWRNYLPNLDQDDSLFEFSDDLVGNNFPAMTPPPSDHSQQQQLQQQSLHATVDGTPSHACNCFTSLTQALHEMHQQSRHQPNSTLALEATLSGSKEITARGEQLLNCTCTTDGSLIMLFAALISKYLSLYACTSSRNNNTTDAHLSLSSPPSCTSLSSDMPHSSSSSRVTIGKYTMDVEDGERIRMEIILMELQKIKNLLLKFRGRVSSSNVVNVDVAYEGHTYETVLEFLNTRLKEAMSRLQRLKQKYQAPA